MTQKHHTHRFTRTEEAITVLICFLDDAYTNLNPRGRRYESLERLSDSEVITLALFSEGLAPAPAPSSSFDSPAAPYFMCSSKKEMIFSGCLPK